MPDLIELSVPAQHDYTDPTVELDPLRLGAWLDDLPLMNVGETVRLALGALQATNEQRMDPALRFACLEVYRLTVNRLFDSLDPLHIRQLSMSRSQRHETIGSIATLLAGMADGYKLVVTGLAAARAQKTGDLFAQVLNRTVEALTCVLLDCYRYYRAVPSGLLRELYILYRRARHDGLLDAAAPSGSDEPGATTAALFHGIILLSLTEPERLAEGESGLLYDVICQYADSVRILQGNHWDNGDGLFLLDLDSDRLPVSCSTLTAPAGAVDPFLVDIRVMQSMLREKLAGIPEKIRLQSPEAIVLRRLTPGGSGMAQRREARHREDRHIELLSGLAAVHAWLADSAAGQARPVDCRVLDSSEGGMKLSCTQGGVGDMRVGELAGIIESVDGESVMRLATIRSVQVLDAGGVESGVQFLAEGMGAVTCSDIDDSAVEPVAALFLPADEAAGIAATLVVPGGVYAESCRLLIDVGGHEIRVVTGGRVSDSPVFDRFEFFAE